MLEMQDVNAYVNLYILSTVWLHQGNLLNDPGLSLQSLAVY